MNLCLVNSYWIVLLGQTKGEGEGFYCSFDKESQRVLKREGREREGFGDDTKGEGRPFQVLIKSYSIFDFMSCIFCLHCIFVIFKF